MGNKTGLTTRQWGLYNLLKADPNRWFSQKEIYSMVDGYNLKVSNSTNDLCSTIGEDKRVINESDITDKIVVMKNYKFKIGTLEEYLEERRKHINKIKSQVKQVQAMDRKFARDGQGKLFNSLLNELTDENEQYHQTFIKGEENNG